MEMGILLVVAGIALVVAVTSLAPRLGFAPPLLLVLLGIALSFVPLFGHFQMESEWILSGILPPLLYGSAVNVNTMEFRRDIRIISGMSVFLVVVSSLVVGVVMMMLLPDLGLALGLAVGAIVSPTDAVATSIVKKAGISSRIITILEGESMLNDGAALVLLRSAVAATAVAVSIGEAVGQFVLSVVIAVAIGWVTGKVAVFLFARIPEVIPGVLLSLTIPFVAAIPSEALGASGLVAAVVAGLVVGSEGPRKVRTDARLTTHSVWQTIQLGLESFVFLTMGLELYALVTQVTRYHFSVGRAVAFGLLITVVAMGVRALFVAVSLIVLNRRTAKVIARRTELDRLAEEAHDPDSEPEPSPRHGWWPWSRDVRRMRVSSDRRRADADYYAEEHLGPRQGVMLVAAGMRGAVTLAAAQSLPRDAEYRPVLVLIAFVVAASTLLVSGSTLRPLATILGLDGSAALKASDRRAVKADLRRAAEQRLHDPDLVRPDGTPFSEAFLRESRAQWSALTDMRERLLEADLEQEYADLRRVVLDAEREELLRLRDIGSYRSAVLKAALQELDADEMSLQIRSGEDPVDS